MTAPTCLCGDSAVTTINTGTAITDAGPVPRYRPSCERCAREWQQEADWSRSQ